jgi:hypothetical protein
LIVAVMLYLLVSMVSLNRGITDRLRKEWPRREIGTLNMMTAINLLGRKHIQQTKRNRNDLEYYKRK